MRAALILAFLILPLTAPTAAWSAILPARAEVVVPDSRDTAEARLILDVKDGTRTVLSILCSGEGREIRCELAKRGYGVAMASLDIDEPLKPGGARSTACQFDGVLLTLSLSDLIQTRPEPYADSYHFRLDAGAAGKSDAEPCLDGERLPPARY